MLVCRSRAPRARALYVSYMHPQPPGGQWASQTAISWSYIFGYGPYPPGYGLGSRTKKRSMMRSFLAFGACTTIPIWAMLWLYKVLGTFFDGLGRFLGFADPQRGVREPVFSLRTICLRGLTRTRSSTPRGIRQRQRATSQLRQTTINWGSS